MNIIKYLNRTILPKNRIGYIFDNIGTSKYLVFKYIIITCFNLLHYYKSFLWFVMEELIEVIADLVNDRLQTERDAWRSIATLMYDSFIKDVKVEENMEVCQSFCHSKLTPINAISVLKIVKSYNRGNVSFVGLLILKENLLCILFSYFKCWVK